MPTVTPTLTAPSLALMRPQALLVAGSAGLAAFRRLDDAPEWHHARRVVVRANGAPALAPLLPGWTAAPMPRLPDRLGAALSTSAGRLMQGVLLLDADSLIAIDAHGVHMLHGSSAIAIARRADGEAFQILVLVPDVSLSINHFVNTLERCQSLKG